MLSVICWSVLGFVGAVAALALGVETWERITADVEEEEAPPVNRIAAWRTERRINWN